MQLLRLIKSIFTSPKLVVNPEISDNVLIVASDGAGACTFANCLTKGEATRIPVNLVYLDVDIKDTLTKIKHFITYNKAGECLTLENSDVLFYKQEDEFKKLLQSNVGSGKTIIVTLNDSTLKCVHPDLKVFGTKYFGFTYDRHTIHGELRRALSIGEFIDENTNKVECKYTPYT